MEGGTPGSSAVLVLPWGEGVGHLLGLGDPTEFVGGLPVLGWEWEGSWVSLPGWKVSLLTGNKVSSAPKEPPDFCVIVLSRAWCLWHWAAPFLWHRTCLGWGSSEHPSCQPLSPLQSFSRHFRGFQEQGDTTEEELLQ